jgi:hypothetical protein
MSGATPPLPNTPPWRGDQLKHRETLPFTFTCTLGYGYLSLPGHGWS